MSSAILAGDDLYVAVTSRDHTSGDARVTCTDDDTGGNTWTRVGESTDRKATLFWKKATAGTASKTVTIAGAIGSSAGGYAAYSGGPVSGDPTNNLTVEDNAAADESHASITPDFPDSIMVGIVFNYNGQPTINDQGFGAADGAANLRWSKSSVGGGASPCACAFVDESQAGGPTATGGFFWTQGNDVTKSIHFAIQPGFPVFNTGAFGGGFAAWGSLAWGAAPAQAAEEGVNVVVPAASLTLTKFAPVVPRSVTIPAASLTTAAFAPVIGRAITVQNGALTLTSFAPTVTAQNAVEVIVPTASLTTARFAPAIPRTVEIPAAALFLAAFAPSVPKQVTVPASALITTPFAPVLPRVVTPDAAALTLTAFAPTVSTAGAVEIVVPTASLTLTTFAPVVTAVSQAAPTGGGGTGLWNWRDLQKEAQERKKVEKEKARKPRIVRASGISMLRRPVGSAEGTVTHVKQGSGSSVLGRAASASTSQRVAIASGASWIHERVGAADGTVLVDKDRFERDELMELVGLGHFEDSL